jgi:hypothetical protein
MLKSEFIIKISCGRTDTDNTQKQPRARRRKEAEGDQGFNQEKSARTALAILPYRSLGKSGNPVQRDSQRKMWRASGGFCFVFWGGGVMESALEQPVVARYADE